ncbi:MAG: class I SAM-dependent rRNA methyltransferase [Alphaproteobacteria bacterium]
MTDASPTEDSKVEQENTEDSETGARETATGFGTADAVLKPRKAGPFLGLHPWVFDTAIARLNGKCDDGGVVELLTDKGRFIARGILNRASRMRVRLYTWDPQQPLDQAFWRDRIDRAIGFRKRLGLDDPAGAARLVFSEADGLSGLIVDRYGKHLVLQVNALAMSQRLHEIVAALVELVEPDSVTVRSEGGMSKIEGISVVAGAVVGELPSGPVFIEEHGLRYGVDLQTGQKTGFYLDQRDNRRVAASYMKNRRVLDMFCYTGAFGLCASRLGAAHEVIGVDSSERAIVTAQANATLNGVTNVRFEREDCFAALDRMVHARERFGAVILDPPKFTRTRRSVNEALRAYHRINRVACELLEPDGILVTCSCSGSVMREDFLRMLSDVSQKVGRGIQVLEQRGASADHPVSPSCPENEYLKCFICRVM